MNFDNCKITDGVSVEGTEINFKNCEFIADGNAKRSDNTSEYNPWIANGSASFTNCSFTGYRCAKIHEAYGTNVDTVIFDGCTFKDCVKKPGIAIGTVDATTTITIKNCTFTNVQAGDQGKYIYESDTDVTKFNFTEENNTVN